MKNIYFILLVVLSFSIKDLLAETPLKSENTENTENIKTAIELLIEVKQLNSDYTKYVIIAATSQTYVWVPIIGTVPAIMVAATYGKKATKTFNTSKEKLDVAIHITKQNPKLGDIKNALIRARELTADYKSLVIATSVTPIVTVIIAPAITGGVAIHLKSKRDLIITDCISDLDDMLSDIKRSDETTTDKE